jgi:hypothetical protein
MTAALSVTRGDMTTTPQEPHPTVVDDQDAEPASQPDGAADTGAAGTDTEDQDSGPASEPTDQ